MHGHNKVAYGSTNVEHGAIISTTQVRYSASLCFQRALNVTELIGSRVGRHDASSIGDSR